MNLIFFGIIILPICQGSLVQCNHLALDTASVDLRKKNNYSNENNKTFNYLLQYRLQWHLYWADTLRTFISVHLIQGVRSKQVLICCAIIVNDIINPFVTQSENQRLLITQHLVSQCISLSWTFRSKMPSKCPLIADFTVNVRREFRDSSWCPFNRRCLLNMGPLKYRFHWNRILGDSNGQKV